MAAWGGLPAIADTAVVKQNAAWELRLGDAAAGADRPFAGRIGHLAGALREAGWRGWEQAVAIHSHAVTGMLGIDTGIRTSATARPGRRAAAERPATAARDSGVFGSVAMGFRRLPALEKMEPAYKQMRATALLNCGPGECAEPERALVRAVADLGDEGFLRKLRGVNALVNGHVVYRRDIDNYGVLDHWATPRETLRRRAGDCEDYAILKLALLEALGVPASSMSVVVLGDERRNLFHAVLSLRTNQGYFILDNLRDEVLFDRDLPHYVPLYSLSAGKGFIHGRRTGDTPVASSARFDAIAPGEGPSAAGIGPAAPPAAVPARGAEVFPVF